MARRLRLALCALAAAAALPASGAEAARAVRCAGVGAPSLRDAASNLSVVRAATRRAARRAALARCRAALGALPLAGGGTVGEALPRDRALAEAVEAAVRRARLAVPPRYFADGGVALAYDVPLDGALGARLAPEVVP